jgi:hypothetical protein
MHRLVIPVWQVALIVTLSACAVSRPAAAVTCPEDTVASGCQGHGLLLTSTEPGFSCATGSWQAGQPCGDACYDLRAGQLQVALPSSAECFRHVGAADDFWISGIPVGPPTLFFAELRVVGSLAGDAVATVGIQEGASSGAVAAYDASDSPVDHTLVAVVTHVENEVFRLHLAMTASSTLPNSTGSLAGVLTFSGLPPSAVVHSCQHYGEPVPTVPRSWGRVKATYR